MLYTLLRLVITIKVIVFSKHSYVPISCSFKLEYFEIYKDHNVSINYCDSILGKYSCQYPEFYLRNAGFVAKIPVFIKFFDTLFYFYKISHSFMV